MKKNQMDHWKKEYGVAPGHMGAVAFTIPKSVTDALR